MQQATLLRILKANETCQLGKKWNFGSIQNEEEFKKHVPLTTYDDYREFHEEMVQKNETGLTTNSEVDYFVPTSGTSGGKSKLIPKIISRAPPGNMVPPFLTRPILLLVHMHSSCHTPGGTPIIPGGSSQLPGMLKMDEFFPSPFVAPKSTYLIQDHRTATYVQTLFGLANSNLGSIMCGFINVIISLFQLISKEWKSLLHDLQHASFSVELDNWLSKEQQNELSNQLKDSITQERIDELSIIFNDCYGDNECNDVDISSKIWPKLTLTSCMCGGSHQSFIPQLKHYLSENVIIYSPVYACSESLIGINKFPRKYISAYELLLPAVYFEFIPMNNEGNLEIDNICGVNNLSVNSIYEIVITTMNGFYRYRLGDLIRVLELPENSSPVIELEGRVNSNVSLFGEKVSEHEVLQAIQSIWNSIKPNYTISAKLEDSQGNYTFWIELVDKDNVSKDDIAKKLDLYLQDINCIYGRLREAGKLLQPKINFVHPGTFEEYKSKYLESQVDISQRKIPRFISSEKQLEFFQNYILNE